jgi:thioredoxin reductase (NADPH)
MSTISPILSGSQLETLAALGEERTAEAGEVLFQIGDEIVRHGASGFLGELNLMTGQTVYPTAVARQPMRYIAVDHEVLRPVLFEDGPLGDVLLSAFIARREALQTHQGTGIKIVGAVVCRDARDGRVRAPFAPPVHVA